MTVEYARTTGSAMELDSSRLDLAGALLRHAKLHQHPHVVCRIRQAAPNLAAGGRVIAQRMVSLGDAGAVDPVAGAAVSYRAPRAASQAPDPRLGGAGALSVQSDCRRHRDPAARLPSRARDVDFQAAPESADLRGDRWRHPRVRLLPAVPRARATRLAA